MDTLERLSLRRDIRVVEAVGPDALVAIKQGSDSLNHLIDRLDEASD